MRRAITIIELLICLALIGILVGLLLPAVQRVRESAARTTCSNNLKQIGLACHSYESTHERLPDGGTTSWADPPGYGWLYQILPHIEQDARYAAQTSGTVPTYCCPDRPRRVWKGRGMTDYAGNAGTDLTGFNGLGMRGNGSDGAIRRRIGGQKGVRFIEFPNGTSNTLLAGEKRMNAALLWCSQTDDDAGWIDGWDWDTVRWTRDGIAPDWRDSNPDHAHGGANAPWHGQFGGPHPAGMMKVNVDGSVSLLAWGVEIR